MNQHWIRPPQARRQLLQWSMSMSGSRVSTVWPSLSMGVGNAPGQRGRESRCGTLMVYRIAEHRQPPFSFRGSGARKAILPDIDLGVEVESRPDFSSNGAWLAITSVCHPRFTTPSRFAYPTHEGCPHTCAAACACNATHWMPNQSGVWGSERYIQSLGHNERDIGSGIFLLVSQTSLT